MKANRFIRNSSAFEFYSWNLLSLYASLHPTNESRSIVYLQLSAIRLVFLCSFAKILANRLQDFKTIDIFTQSLNEVCSSTFKRFRLFI